MKTKTGLVALAALGLVTSACGSTSSASPPSSTTTSTAKARVAANPPAASGTVASVSGMTLEVQNPQSGQTTVNLTASTQITATQNATSTDLAVGDCITASAIQPSSSQAGATTTTLAPNASFTATDITISQMSNGSCSGGFGGGFGGGGGIGGSGPNGTGTSGANQGQRFSGSASGSRGSIPPGSRPGRQNLPIAFGEISAISGSSLTVQSPVAKTGTSTTSSTRTITFNSSTTIRKTGPGTATNIAVNDCVTAFGTTDSVGNVTAQRLSVQPATSNGCAAGFGFGFRSGGARNSQGASS